MDKVSTTRWNNSIECAMKSSFTLCSIVSPKQIHFQFIKSIFHFFFPWFCRTAESGQATQDAKKMQTRYDAQNRKQNKWKEILIKQFMKNKYCVSTSLKSFSVVSLISGWLTTVFCYIRKTEMFFSMNSSLIQILLFSIVAEA